MSVIKKKAKKPKPVIVKKKAKKPVIKKKIKKPIVKKKVVVTGSGIGTIKKKKKKAKKPNVILKQEIVAALDKQEESTKRKSPGIPFLKSKAGKKILNTISVDEKKLVIGMALGEGIGPAAIKLSKLSGYPPGNCYREVEAMAEKLIEKRPNSFLAKYVQKKKWNR